MKIKKSAEAKSGTLAPMAILAALCLAFGVLPTYVIPALDTATNPLAGASAADALVPPFFASNPAHDTLPPAFVEDFHNLGAQVGQSVLPGRGLVVLHRGGTENPVVFAMSTSYTFVALIVLLLLTYVVIRLWLTRGSQTGAAAAVGRRRAKLAAGDDLHRDGFFQSRAGDF